MKTQIITLETHDDLISVRDRMSWAKTPRILLVAPKFERIRLRQVDLKVLQRHATSLGAQLGLVTRTRRIRAEAEALGIPVFESAGQAQREAWAVPVRESFPWRAPDKTLREKRDQVQVKEEAWRSHPVTRLLALSVGVAAVLAIVALFLPRAEIRLRPSFQTQSIVVPVIASALNQSVQISGGVPAYEKRIVVNGSQTVTVTGEGIVPQAKASGMVEFRNLTQAAVEIPAGTVVTAGAVRFVTTKDVQASAGVGKKVTAQITAAEGGLVGNVATETINAIEGRLGLSLSVSNPEPTSGGRERASLQASDADRARAKDLLIESLTTQAHEMLLNEIASDDVPFLETLTLTQILQEEFDPPAGAASPTLTLTMQAEFSLHYSTASDLTTLASLALNASLPSAFSSASDTLTLTPSGDPIVDDSGVARWSMRAERQIVQTIDSNYVLALISGSRVDEASAMLANNLSLTSDPTIRMFPSWWQWIPIVPFRVEVVSSEQ